MARNVRLALGATLVLALLVVVNNVRAHWRAGNADGQRQPSPMTEVAQPRQWVPFSCDLEITKSGDPRKIAGKFYRRSDGSTRRETGPAENASIRVINIKVAPTATYFSYLPLQGWTSQPMDIVPGQMPFRRVRRETKGLSEHPERVEGFEVMRYVDAGGARQLTAPALNFYPLVQETKNGPRETCTNVVIGEPPGALFEPPPGAQVRHDPTPGGIVNGPPGRQ